MSNQRMRAIKNYRYVYLLIIPALMYYIIFSYIPMYGITLAFKDFNFAKGIGGSDWVGFVHFNEMFRLPQFWDAFRNTIIISLGRLIIEFPAPILLALLLNEITGDKLRRIFQTVFTFPHFLSWVVLSGILLNLFGDSGMLNQVLMSMGMEKISLLTDASLFRPLLFLTNIWKEAGWGAIIYLAAIAGINPELYEAARVDGANRLQQMWSVTLPAIRPTIIILFILAVGNMMNGGFEQIFNLYNVSVYATGDILDTYIYRMTFAGGSSFSTSTAIGLIKSILNFAMLFMANLLVRRMGEEGLF